MSRIEQLGGMPDWPALMNATTAALYLEISPASFQALARRNRVRSVDLGLNVTRWRRVDLDQFIETLPVKDQSGVTIDGDPFDEALQRASRRGAQRRKERGTP